jgi:hypothetical protein
MYASQMLNRAQNRKSTASIQGLRNPLSRGLRHNLQVNLVTASGHSGQRDVLVEVVQVGVELAGGGVDGAPWSTNIC